MATLPEASVDAIVTDPPYGLEFMGKEWDKFAPAKTSAQRGSYMADADPGPWGRRERVSFAGDGGRRNERCKGCGKWRISSNRCTCASPDWEYRPRESAPPSMLAFQEWSTEWAREAFRVLKPGGHLLAFSGTRTYHRMVCAIEDAGFEIRDQIGWLYGSGFPKSLDVSKAIDKAAGARGHDSTRFNAVGQQGERTTGGDVFRSDHPDYVKPVGITDAAIQWQGWGTALKPAWEPIVMARKPLIGTVAANVLQHGTGALNVDGCRVGDTVETWPATRSYAPGQMQPGHEGATQSTGAAPAGRWPANIIHDGSEEVLAAFPQTGPSPQTYTRGPASGNRNAYGAGIGEPAGGVSVNFGDTGSAARFFYTAKASSFDRNDGAGKNTHPTVKPTDLMRYLCRLVTPPGGTVLDPFMGSGSTLKAAELEGFDAIGIELEPAYIEIARRRIASDFPLFADVA
jgi:site-specific DNA-methyltransferase (adenine-specific)